MSSRPADRAAVAEWWTEVAAALSEMLGESISVDDARCGLGDHRRCPEDSPEVCDHAPVWHPIIRTTAREALARTGRRVAVMCIDDACRDGDQPRLLGTVNDNWSATGLRNSHWKRWHDGYSRDFGVVELKGVVYLVDSQPELRIR